MTRHTPALPVNLFVAPVSKPAVSPTSQSARVPVVARPAGWETRDTADWEVCATGQRRFTGRGRGRAGGERENQIDGNGET